MTSVQPPAINAAQSVPNNRFKRFLVIGGVLIVALVITAITASLIINALSGTRHIGSGVANGVQVVPAITLPNDNVFPVGIARAADGTLIFTEFGLAQINKLAADGKVTPWLTSKDGITAPGALISAPDSSYYLLDFSSAKPGSSAGVIKRITADGKVSLLSDKGTNAGLSFLSQMALDPQGNLYVTFTVTGEVWRYAPNGQVTTWVKLAAVNTTAAEPTGIAYDAANKALIVADGATGTIYRVPFNPDGSAGAPNVLYRDATLAFQGVTFDDKGRLLLLAWLHDDGQLAQLDASGKYILLAQSFRDPSTLLATADKVYVVNSDIPGLIPLLHAKPPFTIDVVTGLN